MKFIIGEYIFDSERLLLYSRFLPEEEKQSIDNNFLKEDISHLSYALESMDPSDMTMKGKFPTVGIICPTDNCQLLCSYCSNRSTCNATSSIGINDVMAFAKEIAKNYKIKRLKAREEEPVSIYFSGGGEPTFHWKSFFNIVLALKNYFIENNIPYRFDITTNGILNDEQREFIAMNFSNVLVSYDGTSYLQNSNRPIGGEKDSSDIVETSILFFSRFIPTRIRTTLWPTDIEQLKNMADNIYVKFPDILEWSVLPINNTGRAIDNGTQDMFDCGKYDFAQKFIETYKYILQKYKKNNMVSPMFNNNFVPVFCGSSKVKSITLMPNKLIVTCMEESTYMPIVGRIVDDKVEFQDSYNDELMRVCKEKFYECKECLAYSFCRGGCPAKFLRDKEYKLQSAKWDCQMTVNYWTLVFQELLGGNDFLDWTLDKISVAENDTVHVYKLRKLNPNM